MELRVLGPLQVVHDGVESPFRRARACELLALLATRPNVPVSVARLIDEGLVRPIVGARFPLERAAEALELIDERGAVGKVVLDVR